MAQCMAVTVPARKVQTIDSGCSVCTPLCAPLPDWRPTTEYCVVVQGDELVPLDPVVVPLAKELPEEAVDLLRAVAEGIDRGQLGPEGDIRCQ
jgi:hypothetical protein